MTPALSLLNSLVPLVADLADDLPERERYRRLLEALRALLPCDAVALLRLQGQTLEPVAIDGLSNDTLGRRFRVAEHPRLAQLLAHGQALRFAPDSPLPDPYDGLVEHAGPLEVHDCMGCALVVGGNTWGLLTLDALLPGQFADAGHLQALQAFSNLAAATVAAAERMRQLAQSAQDEQLRAESYRQAALPADARRPLLGQSPAFRQLQKDIALVAPSELNVLITGETGVGKELVAQAVHAQSRRAGRPLVSVNCAALPDTLVESELFGHVRGAFTGAVGERQGQFERAHGGTLFLDEVGELSLAVQAKLLRVLQSGQLQRLGSDREHRVDVRVIAATNRPLEEAVRTGRMRADFFHRLSVYPLVVPPLRERGSDILLLCGYFLEENRSRLGAAAELGTVRLDAAAQAALLSCEWPGNVRELEHLISRGVLKALSRHSKRQRVLSVTVSDLWPETGGPAPSATQTAPSTLPAIEVGEAGLRAAVDAYERQAIERSLAAHQGSWAAAARALQMDRANLQRLAKRLGMK
ncbi:nitric oxide reductase transcriptional regulator NorR [Acidovorax sp. Be4]|uniref:Nitric oxide reductase transcriptional regulator NorR n=1 Tax=Acidovorax bellezanensis TaxID=2976702 RepID=A0ABT2PJ66_9BURK|nr:nitric oxide reductase transcriptional regulator NorR [Acidovorax sp. Be4]MCT9810521.1 nitric oxide reductase transcriptional regulator NorR [Acidovorax sp. Be4]